MSQATRNTVRLYCCGGGGINIGTLLESHAKSESPTFAKFDISYIDTSGANLSTTERSADSVYRFKSNRPNEVINGSGGIRRTNAELIIDNVDDILIKHAPADMNVVCFTASGASGSTVGPSLVSELLARGKFVIAMVIGDTMTNNRTKNSASTLKSLVQISKMRKSNVGIYYDENSKTRDRQEVNANMVSTFTSFLVLFSGNNVELDNQDVYNWLNFTKLVPGLEPGLVRIGIVSGKQDVIDAKPITVATLTNEVVGTDVEFANHVPEEQFVGFLRDDVPASFLDVLPIHFVTSIDGEEIVAQVLEKVTRVDEVRKANNTPRLEVLREDENVFGNGLIID